MLDTGSERNETQKMNEKGKSNTKQQMLCLEIDMKCKVVELCIINRESGAKKVKPNTCNKNGMVSTCSHTIVCAYCSMVLHGPRGELAGELVHGRGRWKTKEIFV
jgi:hypothetical protein